MTDEQRRRLNAVSRCVMPPGSNDRKFVRHLAGRPPCYEPTPGQAEMIDRLYRRYRRQRREVAG